MAPGARRKRTRSLPESRCSGAGLRGGGGRQAARATRPPVAKPPAARQDNSKPFAHDDDHHHWRHFLLRSNCLPMLLASHIKANKWPLHQARGRAAARNRARACGARQHCGSPAAPPAPVSLGLKSFGDKLITRVAPSWPPYGAARWPKWAGQAWRQPRASVRSRAGAATVPADTLTGARPGRAWPRVPSEGSRPIGAARSSPTGQV